MYAIRSYYGPEGAASTHVWVHRGRPRPGQASVRPGGRDVRRAQTVAVEVAGGDAAIGHDDTGGPVPWLDVHRVRNNFV